MKLFVKIYLDSISPNTGIDGIKLKPYNMKKPAV